MIDANKIKAMRELKGMSQDELSKRAEVGFITIGRIERGQTKDPGINSIARIAKALQVDIKDLLIS